MRQRLIKVFLILLVVYIIGGLGIIGYAYFIDSNKKQNKNEEQSENLQINPELADYTIAKDSEIVQLKNGDVYSLHIDYVKGVINNKEIKMLAYNKSLPGPVIKVKQGSEINLHLINNSDIETTLHPHGVRVENHADGVVGITQEESVSKDGEMIYKLKFNDPGVYWYHPHFREDISQELGLYGNIIVTPKDENYWNPVNKEIPLFVDDVYLNGNNIPVDLNKKDNTLMGRYGNTMLVNGRSDYNLAVNKGEVIRFFFTNSANTRTFNLTIPGAEIKLVGSDTGRYENEKFIDSFIISPGERYIVEVYFPEDGNYELIHKTPKTTYIIGSIDVKDKEVTESYANQFKVARKNTDVIAEMDKYRIYFDKPIDKNLNFDLKMDESFLERDSEMTEMNGMMMNQNEMMGNKDTEKIEWEDTNSLMNKMSNPDMVKWELVDTSTNTINTDINWEFNKGDLVKIKLYNDPNSPHAMQHPFHVHGQKFLVLSQNGAKNDNLVWKDTVLVPAGDTIEILVEMSNTGNWLMHCHIFEHAEGGMALAFRVK